MFVVITEIGRYHVAPLPKSLKHFPLRSQPAILLNIHIARYASEAGQPAALPERRLIDLF
jgi:hypothetical protein